MKTVFIPNGSRVLTLSMRCASLAFCTLSLLDLMSSCAISVMSLAEWSLVRKCSETVVGLESVDGLSTDLRCSLKWSLSRHWVSPLHQFGAVVALYHVNDVFGVTVNVISDRPGFACSVECERKFVRQICITWWDSFFRMGMSPRAGCIVRLRSFGPN